ncbi:MAG: leucine-rich repeat domain-containing protein [Patescibacteria group bacterium]
MPPDLKYYLSRLNKLPRWYGGAILIGLIILILWLMHGCQPAVYPEPISNTANNIPAATSTPTAPSNQLCKANGYATRSLNGIIHFDEASETKFFLNVLSKGNAALSDIKNLTCLESLSILSGQQVTDLSPLIKLVNLQELDLNDTAVQDISGVGKLTQLTQLTIASSPVSNIAPLSNLKKLRSLNLSDTLVVNLSPLSQLTKLETLNLAQTQVVDFTPLYPLSNLRQLFLAGTVWSQTVLEGQGANWLVDPNWERLVTYPPEIARLKVALPQLQISWLQFGISY